MDFFAKWGSRWNEDKKAMARPCKKRRTRADKPRKHVPAPYPLPEDSPLGGDGQLMVIAAHRYCLGRRSYIVGAAIDWLAKWWHLFEMQTQEVILRDTIQALQDGMAGEAIDVDGWKGFAAFHLATLPAENQAEIKNYLANKPWPL